MKTRAGWWLVLGWVAATAGCDEDDPVGYGLLDAAAADGNQTGDLKPDAGAETAAETAIEVTADTSPDAPPTAACPDPTGERPSRRSEHAGIYDPVRKQVVWHGGSFAVPIECGFPTPTFESDVWAYDAACQQWREVKAGEGPGGRGRHMAAYDAGGHRMIVFGGRFRAGSSGAYTLFNDLWALDLTEESWAPLEPATASIPQARVNGTLVYDAARDRLVLFGGSLATGASYKAMADVWTFDLGTSTWEAVTVAAGPAKRLFQSALWDEGRQWLVLHGGADETAFFNDAKYFDDLWALDFSLDTPTWRNLGALSPFVPDGRFWDGIAHDTIADRYLLFGGHDAASLGNRNDVQAFDPEGKVWTTIHEADTFHAPANGFCDFPPDFSNVDMTSPERRNAMVLVGDGQSAWIYGGKTDCGAIDDTLRLDFATGTWFEEVPATVGESCLRKGGQTCNDLCF